MSPAEPHIYSIGLTCPAGTDFASAITSYASGDTFFGHDESFIGPDGMGQIIAPALPMIGQYSLSDRLYNLLEHAHRDCIRRIASFKTIKRFGMILLLPETLHETAIATEFSCKVEKNPLPRVNNMEIFYGSRVDGLLALHRACMDLEQNAIGGIFVAAVDSHISVDKLDYLNLFGLTHTQQTPYGFIPAEAASVLFISQADMMPDIVPMGRVFGIDWVRNHSDSNKRTLLAGEELSESYRKSCARLEEWQSLDRLIVDLDGARHQTEAFGRAVAAVGTPLSDIAADPEAPINTLGEMGVVTGLVMVALSCGHAPQRNSSSLYRAGEGSDPHLCFLSITTQTDNVKQAANAIIETGSVE